MELHWLSILVITIMVSNSTQGYYDPPQDIYSIKTGYPGAKLHQLQGLDKVPVELYSPSRLITRNLGGIPTLPDTHGSYTQLKQVQVQSEDEKLKKAIILLSNTLPQLISFLEDDNDNDNDYNGPLFHPVSDDEDTIE